MAVECATQRATKERETADRASKQAHCVYMCAQVSLCVCACVYLTAKSSTCDMHGTKSKFNDQVK